MRGFAAYPRHLFIGFGMFFKDGLALGTLRDVGLNGLGLVGVEFATLPQQQFFGCRVVICHNKIVLLLRGRLQFSAEFVHCNIGDVCGLTQRDIENGSDFAEAASLTSQCKALLLLLIQL